MKNKKGFTLIELLAVLLILAIIALIVTPIISKIIGTAKESADRRSVERYVRAAQTFYMESQVDENKKSYLNSNILEQLDLEDIEATGSIIAYTDGEIEMAILYHDRCWTKSTTQSIKNIEMSTDTSNCSVMSSSVLVSSIDAGDDSITINLDNSSDTSVTLTSCKYSTTNGQYDLDGTISGNTCTLAPTQSGTRYYYELIFSDGSKRYGSIQGGAGTVTPNNSVVAGGSGSGGSGSGGSSSGGVVAPVLEGEFGQTIYTGTYLSSATFKFFNVTTGEKCSMAEWQSNGGSTTNYMNSGCLRFYAYMEDDLSYTMILDRNTSGSIKFSETPTAGPLLAGPQLKTDTDSWQGTVTPKDYVYSTPSIMYFIGYTTDGYHARFITADEVAHIVAKSDFNTSTTNSDGWFFLDGGTSASTGATWQTQIATASQQSAYYWLYSYLADCNSYGANNPSGTSTYWTSDVIAKDQYNGVWTITFRGKLQWHWPNIISGTGEGYESAGIRPVITVLKSKLN